MCHFCGLWVSLVVHFENRLNRHVFAHPVLWLDDLPVLVESYEVAINHEQALQRGADLLLAGGSTLLFDCAAQDLVKAFLVVGLAALGREYGGFGRVVRISSRVSYSSAFFTRQITVIRKILQETAWYVAILGRILKYGINLIDTRVDRHPVLPKWYLFIGLSRVLRRRVRANWTELLVPELPLINHYGRHLLLTQVLRHLLGCLLVHGKRLSLVPYPPLGQLAVLVPHARVVRVRRRLGVAARGDELPPLVLTFLLHLLVLLRHAGR